ncbi:hypothetical protein AB0N23_02540 [Streptomyces sp. NPDC052644]
MTAPKLPAATPPEGVFGAAGPGYGDDDIRAVVTVRVAVTRDVLAVALDDAGGWDKHPDEWSVPYIREAVSWSLTHQDFGDLERAAERIPDLVDDPEVGERIRSVYRAVDRAFPYLPAKES